MKKTVNIFIKGFVFSLIPALLTLLGTIDLLDRWQCNGYIGQAVDIDCAKTVCSILGIVSTFILLTANMISHEVEENKCKRQVKQLLTYNKKVFINALKEYLGREYCNMDIRIFVPRKTLIWRVMHLFSKDYPLKFAIKNVEGLAEVGMTKNLKFQVCPEDKVEGLVGECYQRRKIIYDDDLQNTNKLYNLTEYQKSKTSDLKFIIVCPVFSEDKEIIAIVAFDCKHEIKLQGSNDKFIDAILNYTQQLYEYVPELMKCEGGIWR